MKLTAEEKLLRAEQKRLKEIEKWEREKAKPKTPGYMIYFLLIVTVVYMADEITSNLTGQMQSIIATALFAPLVGEEFAVARMSAISTITMMAMVPAFLYKPLCDRYGRRPFLIINTFGMGLACLIVGISTNIPAYLVGSFLITFFTPHDMQAVYIQECAKPEHRAKTYSTVKAAAMLSTFLIPVLRNTFISSTDVSNWRMVFIIPAVFTMVVAVAAWFLIRETDAFIDTRLRQLRMTEEEKEEAKAKKINVEARGGLWQAAKYAFRNKQVRWVLIASGFMMFGQITTMYFETTMTYGFAQQFLAQGMAIEEAKVNATSFVTKALMLFSVGSGLFQFFPGFIADKIGRKKTAVLMAAMMLANFLLYYFGAINSWNPYLVGFCCGATIGSYWYTGDLMGLLVAESTPTNLRASITSIHTMFSGFIFSFAMIAVMVLVNILGDAYIATCTLCTVVPGMALGLLIMLIKARETKGIDMGTITGLE